MKQNQTDIIEQLKKLRQQVLLWEQTCIEEVKQIQKVLNHQLSTNLQKKDINNCTYENIKKQEEQVNLGKQKQIQHEVDGIIGMAQEKLKEIYNPKLKLEKNVPQPPIIRKPPVPVTKKQSYQNPTPMFVPPRNKNQVTGKITQSKIITQNNVFKPQNKKNSAVQSTSVDKIKESLKQIPIKRQQSIENKQKKKFNTNQIMILKPIVKSKNQIAQKYSNKIKQQCKFINFDAILQSYSNEQMGYKAKQQKNRDLFVKHMSSLAATQLALPIKMTHHIKNRGWQGCAWLEGFPNLLAQLKQLIQQFEQYNSNKVDPKKAYKIIILSKVIDHKLAEIDTLKNNIIVPQFVNLSFDFKVPSQNKKLSQNEQIKGQEQVYEMLSKIVQTLRQKDNLTGECLGLLKSLSEISIFNGKRCPVVVQADKHSQWISHL